MYIDSHAHLDFKNYQKDRGEVINRAREEGVLQIINVGAHLASSEASLDLATRYDGLYATIGVHPHDAKDVQGNVIHSLKGLIPHQKVVAIGETGLDFHYDNSPRDIQERVFRTHIRLAHESRLPLVIHSRNADERLITILQEEKAQEVGGVIHCFNGNRSLAQRYLDMGFYLGLGGVITYPKAVEIREAIPTLPLSSILLETDAPYLSPVPYRGKRNEPSYLLYIAKEIARLMKVPLEVVKTRTTQNTKDLFFGKESPSP